MKRKLTRLLPLLLLVVLMVYPPQSALAWFWGTRTQDTVGPEGNSTGPTADGGCYQYVQDRRCIFFICGNVGDPYQQPCD